MRFRHASAVVPLYIEEPKTARLRALYEHDPDVLVWWGTRVECLSALVRRVREGRLNAAAEALGRARLRELMQSVSEVAPSEDVRDRAERLLALHPLRAADALQLAAALVWARERTSALVFVCLDERLLAAARREGFTTLPPEATMSDTANT